MNVRPNVMPVCRKTRLAALLQSLHQNFDFSKQQAMFMLEFWAQFQFSRVFFFVKVLSTSIKGLHSGQRRRREEEAKKSKRRKRPKTTTHPSMPFPNFRRIYQTFRTPEEERNISNSAFYKLCGFIIVCICFSVLRRRSVAAN